MNITIYVCVEIKKNMNMCIVLAEKKCLTQKTVKLLGECQTV